MSDKIESNFKLSLSGTGKINVPKEDLFEIINQITKENEELKEENMQLKFIDKKWNCEHCRAMFERGGCPDHGPCLT